jgi:rubrerythrin
MSNPAHFSASEIFDLAVQTERNGRAFYEAAAAAATDPAVQRIMRNLAHAEGEHEATFRRLRDEAYPAEGAETAEALPEAYANELAENMLALLRARVLPDEATGLRVVAELPNDTAALDFAIAFEKDTILFMQQMRELVPEADREPIGVLIQQEHIHVRLLQQLKDSRA